MTPYELSVAVEVHNQKMKEKQHELQYELERSFIQAFYTAYWQRVEKLSSRELKKTLDKLNQNELSEKKQMSDKEMLKQIIALNALFGGEVVGK